MNYLGIDPGFSGALALLCPDGGMRVWKMPVVNMGYNRIDLRSLLDIIRELPHDTKVGLENPTTRPGEGSERCFRFGRGIGNLEALLFARDIPYELIPPANWKKTLGLPGKDYDPDSKRGFAMFKSLYPAHVSLVTGPRGGILDGPLDAALIAHYIKSGGKSASKWSKSSPPVFRGLDTNE